LRSWSVPSQSRPGVEYTVSVDDGGVWSCTCPHYTYRRSICKHIVMVQTELSAPKPRYVVHPMVRDGVIEDRDYQRRFVEKALEANTLAVLPTALGKTVIAELVAAELQHRYPGCRILFMAPTKPLALQHRESVLKHLKLGEDEVAAVTGETAARASVWSNSRVRFVTATPQTVWNDYRNGSVRLEEFALLVFDECHRSRSRYAYTRLAEEYVRRCPYPLILALTASPGSEEDKVVEVIKNLWIEQVVWMSEDDEEVSKYIPGIRVGWVRVKLPAEYEQIRDEIKRMIESVISRLRESGLLRMPIEAVNRKVLVGLMNRIRAEIDSGVKGPNIHYMTLLSAALSLYHAQELIESQHVHSLKHYLEEISRSELRSHKIIASTPDFRNLVRMVNQCTVDHSKVDALASTLEAHFAEKPGDRVLVFANIRATAEVLVDRLRDRGYRAALFIGRAEGKHGPRMSQDEQMKTLRAFREGVYNVLVATSVGEEGLDIPECGLVVFYEPAVSGIRYIQRRGRTGRKLPGKAVILVADKTVDEYYFREGYRRARRMDKILQQASQKTVKVERKASRPQPGTPWPWTKTEAIKESEPVIEIDVTPKQVSERELVSVEPMEEVVSVEGPSSRELYYCRKNIYETLLKAGDKGVTLHEIMESISYSPEAVRKSLSRLEREGLVKKVGDKYVTTAIIRSKPLTVKPQGRIHTIAVEKIYPGFAVVMVDDSFRARLEPSAYNGPRDLIKKGRRFKARATITKMEGATTILIHDVVEA
jgi:ERCC4-related helicase/DNA-binding transcriptional ArsR family regulator